MLTQAFPVYGLRLSAARSLPGLAGTSPLGRPDVRLSLRRQPRWLRKLAGRPVDTRYTSPDLDDDGRPSFVVYGLSGGKYYRLCFSDGAAFIADRKGTRIWADWPDPLTPEDIAAYLFGPVIGWVLRLRGVVCLHASAVAVDDQAIAFVGPSGAGKSTIAAALAQRGFRVLTDDIAAIYQRGGRFTVPPGYPGVRLCPESVAALYGSADALPSLAPGWGKLLMDLRQGAPRFQDTPLALAAIYVLSDNPTGGKDRVHRLTGPAALLSLVTNTHAGRLLNPALRGEEFELLARLVGKVPIREIAQGQNLDSLEEFCDVLLEDLAATCARRENDAPAHNQRV